MKNPGLIIAFILILGCAVASGIALHKVYSTTTQASKGDLASLIALEKKNAAAIAANKSAISANRDDAAAAKNSATSNGEKILNNSTSIASLQTGFDTVAANKKSAAANTVAIAANKTEIAANKLAATAAATTANTASAKVTTGLSDLNSLITDLGYSASAGTPLHITRPVEMVDGVTINGRSKIGGIMFNDTDTSDGLIPGSMYFDRSGTINLYGPGGARGQVKVGPQPGTSGDASSALTLQAYNQAGAPSTVSILGDPWTN